MNGAESHRLRNEAGADCDLLIVGAGMVGATLALACGMAGMRVVIVDSQAPAADIQEEYDLRVSAITLASRAIFRNLSMWDDLVRRRVSPMREMYVWDPRGSGTVHFDASDIGEAQLGYIVENRVIAHVAQSHLARFPTVNLVCPAAPVAVEFHDAWVKVILSDGKVFTAKLVVGADGAQSRVRELAGIDSRGGSYDQIGIVATVRTSVPHGEAARQAFLASGPLAFLPLCDPALSSIVWSCDSRRGQQLLELGDDAFCRELQSNLDDRLGEVRMASARAAFPLGFAHAERYVDARLALVGDAAHRVHPLAGQGVNLGLLDAAVLAEVVGTAFRSNRDIGSYAVLRRYERWRKGGNLMMLAATDAFKRVFGLDYPPVLAARNIGLAVADVLGPVKRRIMRYAVGLEGDLPPLARELRRKD
ncbi:MAG: UbiH/UbiF/VisC/COQ6 family ubiquinone biosynthesis hydroxylase [Gammaproteobacteria bacterium]|nr:UbiH/UbiF/VisC/COQ6 family ubiquinone biosynthesis hydroxylase [Gammaproteobacteria bacterium]